MSYYQPHPAKNRTAVWVGLAVVLVPLVLVGAYFLGRGSRGAATPGGQIAPATPSAPAISWSIVGDEPVPSSPDHGPRTTAGGLAKGFTHDTLGAALAAVNIGVRLASEVGPQVYEPTVREQCFGNIDSEIEQIRNSFSTAPPGAAKYSEVWYRVASGDPASDLVLISIAVKTPQSVERGGYVRLDNTMQWINGDWRLQVPTARPLVIPSVEGYTLLGRPNV
jgi:hypothetical protein